MEERNDMRGQVTVQLSNRAGQTVYQQRFKNRIVTSGRRLVAEFFSGQAAGPPPTPVTHMAVGENNTSPADGQTALLVQRGNRNAINSINVVPFDEGGVMRVRVSLQAVFDFDEVNNPTVPLQEAGVFTASTGGVMYNRVVFAPVTKTNAFRLTLFWDVVF
jgi:hypothetical protein